ncbi:hypothetical protein VSR68_10340 [Paraburkholderia phymatum]|uniref:hypothetical protein n=1 Tax=Paraburkholderia phymatum TaxID=148447 RepID=UPI00317D0D01
MFKPFVLAMCFFTMIVEASLFSAGRFDTSCFHPVVVCIHAQEEAVADVAVSVSADGGKHDRQRNDGTSGEAHERAPCRAEGDANEHTDHPPSTRARREAAIQACEAHSACRTFAFAHLASRAAGCSERAVRIVSYLAAQSTPCIAGHLFRGLE